MKVVDVVVVAAVVVVVVVAVVVVVVVVGTHLVNLIALRANQHDQTTVAHLFEAFSILVSKNCDRRCCSKESSRLHRDSKILAIRRTVLDRDSKILGDRCTVLDRPARVKSSETVVLFLTTTVKSSETVVLFLTSRVPQCNVLVVPLLDKERSPDCHFRWEEHLVNVTRDET